MEHAKQEKQSEVKRVNVSIKVDPEDTVQFPWLSGALVQEKDLFFFNFYAAKFFFMLCSLHCELAQAGACLSLLLQHYVSRNRDLRIY